MLVEPKEDNLVEVMADLLGFAMVGKMVELMVGQKVHKLVVQMVVLWVDWMVELKAVPKADYLVLLTVHWLDVLKIA